MQAAFEKLVIVVDPGQSKLHAELAGQRGFQAVEESWR